MIKVRVLKEEGKILGFDIMGHAGCGEHGYDIICSAASMLVINTLNSIDTFTKDKVILDVNNEEVGHIKFRIDNGKKAYSSKTDILLRSLELGLQSIKDHYGDNYIQVEEVQ